MFVPSTRSRFEAFKDLAHDRSSGKSQASSTQFLFLLAVQQKKTHMNVPAKACEKLNQWRKTPAVKVGIATLPTSADSAKQANKGRLTYQKVRLKDSLTVNRITHGPILAKLLSDGENFGMALRWILSSPFFRWTGWLIPAWGKCSCMFGASFRGSRERCGRIHVAIVLCLPQV